MVKVRTCECCGHPLPDLEIMLDLTNMQGRMFVAIQRAGRRGISGFALIEQIYKGKPPKSAHKGLGVMKYNMEHVLQKHGLKMLARRGPGSIWRLEAIGG